MHPARGAAVCCRSHPSPKTQTKKKKSMFPKFGKSKKKADAADAPPPVPEAEPAKAPTPPPPGMREDATPIPVLSESLGKASLGGGALLEQVGHLLGLGFRGGGPLLWGRVGFTARAAQPQWLSRWSPKS